MAYNRCATWLSFGCHKAFHTSWRRGETKKAVVPKVRSVGIISHCFFWPPLESYLQDFHQTYELYESPGNGLWKNLFNMWSEHALKRGLGGGFQILAIFTPTEGNDPILLLCFKWVETTNRRRQPAACCSTQRPPPAAFLVFWFFLAQDLATKARSHSTNVACRTGTFVSRGGCFVTLTKMLVSKMHFLILIPQNEED